MKYNRIQLIGNLASDPEKKQIQWNDKGETKDGIVCEFNLAVNRYKKDETDFFKVQMYNSKAERAYEYLKKGSPVFIEGSIHLDRVQKVKDGVEFHNMYCFVNASDFQALEKKSS